MKHLHVIPVPQGSTADEAWREITREGRILDTTLPIVEWATIKCDGEECDRVEVEATA